MEELCSMSVHIVGRGRDLIQALGKGDRLERPRVDEARKGVG